MKARVEAVLARGVTDANDPKDPAAEFSEDAEKIYVALKSTLTESASVEATWAAVNAEGYEPNQTVGTSRVRLQPGQRGAMWIGAPRDGFAPGDYRLDLKVNETPEGSLAFKVTPLYPNAALVEQVAPIAAFNLALAALGGRVESATSEYDQRQWAASNLIDDTSLGWSSKDKTVPQEVVVSFYQNREAVISALVIDTRTSETVKTPDRAAKHVEVWVSTSNSTDGFTKVTGARLRRRPAEQLITLPPTRAKYVRLKFLSNHGGSYIQVGEVKIYETREGMSILADMPKNIVLPGLGGAIVRFTSQRSDSNSAAQLTDGRTDTTGWWSGDGYLPQDLVFAFRADQVALIDRIILNPKTAEPSTWVKAFTVSVSTESPLDGFQEVGQFTLAQEPRDQAFPIGRRARFVRLRIIKNHGGSRTSLGEVQLIEGTATGYQSVVMQTGDTAGPSRGAAATQAVDETGIAVEKESNNTAAEANPLELGRRTKGTIEPLGENDYFRLSIPGSSLQILTLELLGRPYIRTSLAVLDAAEKPLKRFDPGGMPSQQLTFSWAVPPGDHLIRVTEPPVSIVLIWDTSGSMQGSTKDLRQAVEGYLDQVRPSERLNLIRFSKDIEVLLPEFTSDRERLKAASGGKFFAEGGTPLYDAVGKGIELLEGVTGNRAIVVMTDGEDSASKMDYPAFWRMLEEKRIRLYAVGLGADLVNFVPKMATRPVRMMAHIAMATNGRFFHAKTSDDLKGVYQQIADELRTVSTYYLKATLSQGPGGLAVAATGERLAAVSAPSQIELILDASGSMTLKVEGRPKIDAAKDVMSQIIKGLPDDAQVALRIYGHRIREGRPGDCRDTELVFPFGKIDKVRMLAKVRDVQALGTTPIDYTLRQVAHDFGGVRGEKLVILVTDGKEECKGDPAAAVAELLSKGLKVRLNIVGFALADAATKRDMERVAQLTGGKFFDAKNALALTQAIEQSLAVPFDVLDAAGVRIGGGLTGQGRISVPEGIYTVVVHAAGKPVEIPNVRIAQNGFTKVVLKKEGQQVGIQVLGP